VERKFLLPVDPDSLEALRRRIVAKGGALIKRISFEDSYFDSPSYSLTLGDHWLRQRDGAWELKVPGRHVGGTAVYTELETEPEIASALAKQLEIPAPPTSLDELLEQCCIAPFATFGTTRESFSLPLDGGYHIDLVSAFLSRSSQPTDPSCRLLVVLARSVTPAVAACCCQDMSSFGYGIGEIEVMCAEASEVEAAAERIGLLGPSVSHSPLIQLMTRIHHDWLVTEFKWMDGWVTLGSELGVTMATEKGQLQSKVSKCLLSNRPAHHAALKEAGII
jgi:thiamine-triphosphatase